MSVPTTARAARDLATTWLSHLPTDPRGLPVPWINRWGGETLAAARISYDRHISRPAIFHDDHGDIPDFTRQNMGRQREAIMAGRCQVCGRACPWSRRNVVVSGATCEPVRVPGIDRAVTAISEPWLDDRCAAIARLLCPALIRRAADDDYTLIPVRRRADVHLLVSVGTLTLDHMVDGGAHPDHVARLRAAVDRGPLAMWAKIVLLSHRVVYANDAAPAGPGHATAG